MSIGAIGSVSQGYSPAKSDGKNIAELEKQVEALNKKLQNIKQNDKLDSVEKSKQIISIQKEIAKLEKKISQIKMNNNDSDKEQPENKISKRKSRYNKIDKFA